MAVYLVVAIVALQVIMVISVFWLRAMVVPVNVRVPTAQTGKTGTTSNLIGPVPSNSGNNVSSIPRSNLPSLPPLSVSAPHTALLTVPDASNELEQIGNLNDQAKIFLRQNDFASAEETLIKAEDIDPRNPNTLKSLAETYNLMNDFVRSRIYWQRLVDLGPGVGTVYAVAKDHVLLLESGHDADPLRAQSGLNRLIYIDDVEKSPVETRNGEAQFHLGVSLKRKDPKMANFDQKKLQPYVIFYQQKPDGKIVLDLGKPKGFFDDTFLFWSGKLSEAFGVDYIMPVPGTSGPNDTTQGKYYGFVIGIYYDKILQDARSEPSDLLARMPLPTEIE